MRRLRRLATITACGAILVLVPGVPASAGGSHVEVARQYHAEGGTVTFFVQGFGTLSRAEQAAGPYYAFVVSGDGYPTIELIRSEGIRLGRLVDRAVSPNGSWSGWAGATSSLAGLEPGPYGVHFCNDPCTHLFPAIAGSFTVTATSEEARILNEASALVSRGARSTRQSTQWQARRLQRMVGRVQDSLRELQQGYDERTDSLELDVATLRLAVERLARDAAEGGASGADSVAPAQPARATVPIWVAGLLVAAAASGAFLAGRRRGRRTDRRDGTPTGPFLAPEPPRSSPAEVLVGADRD